VLTLVCVAVYQHISKTLFDVANLTASGKETDRHDDVWDLLELQTLAILLHRLSITLYRQLQKSLEDQRRQTSSTQSKLVR
jgi:hypothetical protein